MNLERDDLEALSHIPLFPLVSEQVPKYDIVYAGRQPVDELMTFVFRVAPKQLDKGHAYFSGLIWVDDHDLAIVKSYGKWVSESGDVTFVGRCPSHIFETYRQPVANKYWMPAYSRSESEVMPKKGSVVPVRLTVRWDQFTPVAGNQSPTASTSEIFAHCSPLTSSIRPFLLLFSPLISHQESWQSGNAADKSIGARIAQALRDGRVSENSDRENTPARRAISHASGSASPT